MNRRKINLFELFQMRLQTQQRRELIERFGPSIKKKELNELRKEAKKRGMKISGEYGKDGQYHVYVSKGSFKRQIA